VLAVIGSALVFPLSFPLTSWLRSRELGYLRPAIESLGHLRQPTSIAVLATAIYIARFGRWRQRQ
jgi:hypothetical protein